MDRKEQIPASLQYALDAITGARAFVRNAEDALRLLGSLAATPDQAGQPQTAGATE